MVARSLKLLEKTEEVVYYIAGENLSESPKIEHLVTSF